MTLNNLVNRIWLRFIELLYKLTLHFLWKDGLCRLGDSKDGLFLITSFKSQQTLAFYKHHSLTLSHS